MLPKNNMEHQVAYIKLTNNPLLTCKRSFVSGTIVKEVLFLAEEARTYTSNYLSYCKQTTAHFIKSQYFSKKYCLE